MFKSDQNNAKWLLAGLVLSTLSVVPGVMSAQEATGPLGSYQCDTGSFLFLDTETPDDNNNTPLFSVDNTTGEAVEIADYADTYEELAIVSENRSETEVYTIREGSGGGGEDELILLSPVGSGDTGTLVGPTDTSDIDAFAGGVDGNLYSVQANDGDGSTQVYQIDPDTAATTDIGTVSGLESNGGDIVAHPSKFVYATNNNGGEIYTIDRTGDDSLTANLAGNLADNSDAIADGFNDLTSLAYQDGTYYALDDDVGSDASTSSLYAFQLTEDNELTNVRVQANESDNQYNNGGAASCPQPFLAIGEDDTTTAGGGGERLEPRDDSDTDSENEADVNEDDDLNNTEEVQDQEEEAEEPEEADEETEVVSGGQLLQALETARGAVLGLLDDMQMQETQTMYPNLPNTGDGTLDTPASAVFK